MSEEQLAALLATIKEDAGLREKLQGAAGLDAAVALANEAGFDVSKADWLRYQAKQTWEWSEGEREGAVGVLRMGEGSQVENGFCVWQIASTGEERPECVGITSAFCTVRIHALYC